MPQTPLSLFAGNCQAPIHPAKSIFEADDFSVDDLDWQCLYMEFVKLSKVSYALYNRERIFRILEGTRDRLVLKWS